MDLLRKEGQVFPSAKLILIRQVQVSQRVRPLGDGLRGRAPPENDLAADIGEHVLADESEQRTRRTQHRHGVQEPVGIAQCDLEFDELPVRKLI